MGRKLEVEIEVRPGDAYKRQSLVLSLDAALLMAGMRVRAGTYKITVESVPKPKEKKLKDPG